MALQVVQILFAVAIVAAFAAVQLGVAHPDELGYLLTNLVSSAALAVTAVLTAQSRLRHHEHVVGCRLDCGSPPARARLRPR